MSELFQVVITVSVKVDVEVSDADYNPEAPSVNEDGADILVGGVGAIAAYTKVRDALEDRVKNMSVGDGYDFDVDAWSVEPTKI